MAIPIIISGALGRMGREIAGIILSDETVHLRGCLEFPGNEQIGEDYGVCIGRGTLGVKVGSSVETFDPESATIIDFSSPSSTRALLEKASQSKFRLVIGTTGLGESEKDLIERAAKKSAILASPNMSLGVNLLFLLTELVASRLKDTFDIEIIEAHHRFKKDAPSGTAKRLGEIVAGTLGLPYDDAVRNGRAGLFSTTRSNTEIGMHAVRAGDIVGDHTVLFAGIGERIELRHMAHSRSTFAQGAVSAAKWLSSREPGLYSIKDVLGL